MSKEENSSRGVRLWIIFGLFIGLIIGLIVYEVRQYVLAKEQRENFEAIRKMQSEQIKETYKRNETIRASEPATEQTSSAESDTL